MSQMDPTLQSDPSALLGINPYTTDTRAFQEGQLESGIKPTYGGKFKELVRQTLESSPVGFPGFAEGALVRGFRQWTAEHFAGLEGQSKISPDEANKRYPGLPKPFDEPVYPEVAELIYRENERKKRNQAWIDRGPETGLPTSLAAGLAGGLDPLNVLSAMGIGAGFRAAGIAQNLASVYAENFLANAAGQVPGYIQSIRERQNPDLLEEGKNAAMGALFGTGLHYLFRTAGERFDRTARSVRENGVEAAIIQHESGSKIDMTPAVAGQVFREAGQVQPGVENGYSYQSLAHPSDVHYYAPLEADSGANVPMGEDFGPGHYAVDDPAVARNHAGTPESPLDGQVNRVALAEDTNLVNLDEPLPKALVSQAFEEIKKAGLEGTIAHKDLEAMTGKQIFDVLRSLEKSPEGESAIEMMGARAQGEGFDGYRYTGSVDGAPLNNRVMLFDQSKATLQESYVADKAKVPQMTQQEAQAASDAVHSPNGQRLTSQEAKIEMQSAKPIEAVAHAERLRVEEAQARASLERRLQQVEDPELRAEIERIDREHEFDKQVAEAAKTLGDCLEGRFL